MFTCEYKKEKYNATFIPSKRSKWHASFHLCCVVIFRRYSARSVNIKVCAQCSSLPGYGVFSAVLQFSIDDFETNLEIKSRSALR